MKRIVLIFRFGKDAPVGNEMPLLAAIAGCNARLALGIPVPNKGMITLIYTDWSPTKIAEGFYEVGKGTGDRLPVLVMDTTSPGFAINSEDFGPAVSKAFELLTREIKKGTTPEPLAEDIPVEARVEVKLSLDQLLDLVSKVGLTNLSNTERIRLDELSKESL